MTKLLKNTEDGNSTYDTDEEVYYPGQVSETEAIIYRWVRDCFGESEAQNPSWDIHELAMTIDMNKGKEEQNTLEDFEIGYDCESIEDADDFDELYAEDLKALNEKE